VPESDPPTDAALLAREAVLQAEAADVLADLGLLARLGTVGRPVVTGSVALGLMVARDIDVTTLCPALTVGAIFDLGRPLAAHPRLRQLAFRNDTGRWNVDPDYPDGLYWGLEYRAVGGEPWNLDLWFLREGTRQFDLDHVESLPARLNRETRLAILRIKTAWHEREGAHRTIRGYDIYEAVLDHGIRTPEEFETHLAER
jgi:hypothetical protein